jgi:hypothetical protein
LERPVPSARGSDALHRRLTRQVRYGRQGKQPWNSTIMVALKALDRMDVKLASPHNRKHSITEQQRLDA